MRMVAAPPAKAAVDLLMVAGVAGWACRWFQPRMARVCWTLQQPSDLGWTWPN